MTTRTKRTDPHRPGAIVPAEYEAMLDYSMPTSDGGWPIPAIAVDCVIERAKRDAKGLLTGEPGTHLGGRCCVRECERVASENGRAVFGGHGRCGVCGAYFVYGTLYRHHPTGELVHMGHDCADKYEMLRDRSEWEFENGRVRAAAAKACTRARNDEQRADFLAAHPGLAEALEVEHPIISDIKARFIQWRELSDKQVALVMKIADEVRNPKPPAPEDIKVPGPLGKHEFTGKIVSAKVVEGQYGSAWKITVKVAADGGCWMAWGTAPQALLDDVIKAAEAAETARREAYVAKAREMLDRGEDAPAALARGPERYDQIRDGLRGREVTLRATLEAGNEVHFRFMKRPTLIKAKVA